MLYKVEPPKSPKHVKLVSSVWYGMKMYNPGGSQVLGIALSVVTIYRETDIIGRSNIVISNPHMHVMNGTMRYGFDAQYELYVDGFLASLSEYLNILMASKVPPTKPLEIDVTKFMPFNPLEDPARTNAVLEIVGPVLSCLSPHGVQKQDGPTNG